MISNSHEIILLNSLFFLHRLKKDAMAYGDVAEECTKPILGHRAHYAK